MHLLQKAPRVPVRVGQVNISPRMEADANPLRELAAAWLGDINQFFLLVPGELRVRHSRLKLV
ncbi:hypothetical protein [Paraburkholderia sp.]|uniref:hypothetical protein n=1 Tax=Paraburkholderia sp. TaxID=1926495 RepID=UPI00286FA0C8|nr:hypothetical protein [Paraburkholderia sp.]